MNIVFFSLFLFLVGGWVGGWGGGESGGMVREEWGYFDRNLGDISRGIAGGGFRDEWELNI